MQYTDSKSFLSEIYGRGSPILNTQGKVIGINQAMLESFAGSNFGIPSRFGLELMDQK